MARPPAYRLYRGELATMQAGNDLQAMIKMAKMHEAVLGGKMVIKDAFGNVVWEGNDNGKA